MGNFSEILKELRKNNEISQKELAEAIGYGKTIVFYWEHGEREPSLSAIISLCKFFDVSADFLIGLEDETGAKAKYNNSFNNTNFNNNKNVKF